MGPCAVPRMTMDSSSCASACASSNRTFSASSVALELSCKARMGSYSSAANVMSMRNKPMSSVCRKKEPCATCLRCMRKESLMTKRPAR